MFNRTLSLAEQGGKRALATEAPDYPLGSVHFFFHGSYSNEFFVIMQGLEGDINDFFVNMQSAAERVWTTETPVQGFDRMGRGHSKPLPLLLLANALRAHVQSGSWWRGHHRELFHFHSCPGEYALLIH